MLNMLCVHNDALIFGLGVLVVAGLIGAAAAFSPLFGGNDDCY